MGVEIVRVNFTRPHGVIVWEGDGGKWAVGIWRNLRSLGWGSNMIVLNEKKLGW